MDSPVAYSNEQQSVGVSLRFPRRRPVELCMSVNVTCTREVVSSSGSNIFCHTTCECGMKTLQRLRKAMLIFIGKCWGKPQSQSYSFVAASLKNVTISENKF